MSKSTFLPKQNDHDIHLFDEPHTEESARQMIREMNLKITQQRITILKALRQGHRHITAQELYEKVLKADSTLGFATVYRFLKALVEAQFVTEVRMGGLPARYELAPKHHHDHLTCVKCGKICEFENKSIEDLQLRVAEMHGFTLTHHILELYGICGDCQKSRKAVGSKNGENRNS